MPSDHSFLARKRDYSPELQTIANRAYRAIGWMEEADQISTFDLCDVHDPSRSVGSSAADSTRPAPSRILQHQPERYPKNQSAALSEAGIVGPIMFRWEGRLHQALLLTADMYEWIQDIARSRESCVSWVWTSRNTENEPTISERRKKRWKVRLGTQSPGHFLASKTAVRRRGVSF